MLKKRKSPEFMEEAVKVFNNWKDKNTDQDNKDIYNDDKQSNEEFAKLSTLEQKSNAIRKKTLSRILFTAFGGMILLFLVTGAVKIYYAFNQQSGEREVVKKTKAEKVELKIDSYSIWQQATNKEISTLKENIKSVDANLTSKINNLSIKFKEDLNDTKNSILLAIKDKDSVNSEELQNLVDDIKREIEKSNREAKKYTNNKALSLEQKIEALKKLRAETNKKIQEKIDFSRLSLPKLPGDETPNSLPSNKKPIKIVKHFDKKERLVAKSKKEYEVVEEEVAIEENNLITTLNPSDINKTKDEEEMPTFTIMSGFSKGVIVAGADVPTLAQGQDNPKPIWISLDDTAIIANDDRMDLGGCLVLANAIGDYSAGVASLRLSKISCSATDRETGQRYKISSKVSGWVYSDIGKYGIKGRLISKEVDLIKAGIPLSAVQAMIEALSNYGNSNTPTLIAGNGGGIRKEDLKKGFGQGTSKTLEKFSDYYMKILESLTPIIEVNAGKKVVVAFKGDEDVQFKKYKIANVSYFEDREVENDENW